jgi:hypothetical protein
MVAYRLWDSDVGFVDVAVNGWLIDAIKAAGMPRPRRVQFFDVLTGQWLDVMPAAVSHASRQVAA